MARLIVGIAVGLLLSSGTVSGAEVSDSGPVMKPVLSDGLPEKVESYADRIYQMTQRQAHHLLATVHPWKEDVSLKLLTDSRSGEHWIRPNTGAVSGFAFLYRFGPYDERTVGVSRQELLDDVILPMMRYLTATHRTGTRATSDGRPWGDAWQSAHWAQMLGRAGWWIWEDLPPDVRAGIRRVIAHEADRIARSTPPHQIRGDTKAEENAWNAQIFSAAMLIMPDDPRRENWETQFQRWAMSSFLRPADAECERLVDGRPVRDQFTGANIYDDFTLENHGFVHPDYMGCFGLSMGCALDYLMTGRRPPDALSYNVAEIFANLKFFLLPDGGSVYPSGQDWTLFREPSGLGTHSLMAIYGRDPHAWSWFVRTLVTVEKMQARNPDGAVYTKGEYFFPSTQHDRIYSLGRTWLWLHFADDLVDKPVDLRGVLRLEAGRIILNRTATSVHSVSWGARCMAQCVPLRLDRMVSPDQRNGIGSIRLAGSSKPLPVKVIKAAVTNGDDWFASNLVVEHGDGLIRAQLEFESRADGVWVVREKLAALKDVTTDDVATGLIGILNNPTWVYERGHRTVIFDGRTTEIKSLSGQVADGQAVKRVAVDDVLKIESDEPLQVRYVGATSAERGRATDRLYLNVIPGERKWLAGETISKYEVVVAVGLDGA